MNQPAPSDGSATPALRAIRRRLPRLSEKLTIRLAMSLAALLVLATVVFAWPSRALSGRISVLRDNWPIHLLEIQAAGMGLLLLVGGFPRSKSGKLIFAVVNLVLLELAALAFTHSLDQGLDVGIRAGVVGTWLVVVMGLPVVVWRLFARRRSAERIAFPFGKWWFSAAVLLLAGEPLAAFIEHVERRPTQVRLPEFLPPAPEGELRVATVGESTMIGFPYDGRFGIPKVVEWQLKQMYPGRTVFVDDVSARSLNLPQAVERLNGLKYRPHLLILYSGHNEFFHDLNELSAIVAASPAHALDDWLDWSPLIRVFNHQLSRKIVLSDMQGGESRQLVETPVATPTVQRFRLARFRSQLEQLADWSRRLGIPSLWFVPAGSEADYEPNRSCLPHAASRAEREEIRRISDDGRRLEAAGRWDAAANVFREALDRFPGFADFHFQLAECLAHAGDFPNAARNYALALENDGHPARMTEPYRRQVAEVAAAFGIPVVDAAQTLRPHTPHGILDRSVFLDHVHPNLHGYYDLGMAAVERINRAGLLRARFGDSAPPRHSDFASAVAAAGLAANDLAVAYDRIAAIDGVATRLRYEGARLQRDAHRYLEWARRLRSGEITPGQAGTESLR